MALPTYQATGTVVESASNDVTVDWPAHQADDIGLLIVEHGPLIKNSQPRLTTDAGFRPIPWGHVKSGNGTSAARTSLTVFWCRATSGSMPSPVVRMVEDHVRAVIITIRGCSATGVPWDIGNNGVQDTDQTAISIPGFTTTQADCLVVAVVASAGSGRSISGAANADLGSVTERVDSSSTIGDKDGSHFAVITGTKAVAGAVGATTATYNSLKRHVTFSIALTGTAQAAQKTPYIQNYGLAQESAVGDITVPWPAHVAGDLALLIVESNSYPIDLVDDAGFTALIQQGNHTSGDPAACAIGVWFKIASGTVDNEPVVDFTADHIRGYIVTVRGHSSSDPFGPVEASASAGTSATYTGPTDTTTVLDNLQITIVGHGNDSEGTQNYVGTPTNSSLADLHIAEQGVSSAAGTGSGIAIITGRKAVAGAYNATTGSTSQTQRNVVVVINVQPPTVDTLVGDPAIVNVTTQQASFKVTTPTTHTSYTVTGQDATLTDTVEAFQGEPAFIAVTGQDAGLDSIGTPGGEPDPEEPPPEPTFWVEEVLPPEADWEQEL